MPTQFDPDARESMPASSSPGTLTLLLRRIVPGRWVTQLRRTMMWLIGKGLSEELLYRSDLRIRILEQRLANPEGRREPPAPGPLAFQAVGEFGGRDLPARREPHPEEFAAPSTVP